MGKHTEPKLPLLFFKTLQLKEEEMWVLTRHRLDEEWEERDEQIPRWDPCSVTLEVKEGLCGVSQERPTEAVLILFLGGLLRP